MRSYGSLMAEIVSKENVEVAVERAARGKHKREAVRRFLAERGARVEELCFELTGGRYRPRPYQQFRILDPKPRLISCADFRDRVVHHALCGVIGPLVDRRLIADNYACRIGKGTHRALLRARELSRRHDYYLKTDIRRFFDSVDHELLLRKLTRMFREPALHRLLTVIVRHPVPGQSPGRGLPIGNLTSQWFANLYLDEIDHWAKEARRASGYVRYMDDIVVWSDSKDELHTLAIDLEDRLSRRLHIHLKTERTIVAPVSEGIPFLGWRVFPGLLRQQGARVRRQRRLLRRRETEHREGTLSAAQLVDCARSLAGTRAYLGFGEPLRCGAEL